MSIIMIVDDQELNLLILKTLLEKNNCHCTVVKADSGREAITMYQEFIAAGEEVKHIISDYNMPGMDGNTLINELFNLGFRGKRDVFTADDSLCICDFDHVQRLFYKPISKTLLLEIMQCGGCNR